MSAHELSHLWFVGADVSSWEDWLNESFAEYASLLFIEDKYGRQAYDNVIDKFKEYTEKCPSIKDSDRNSKKGSKVRYKGTVLLHQIRELFGIESIKEVFNQLDQLKVKRTENLINELKLTNEDVAYYIEEKIDE